MFLSFIHLFVCDEELSPVIEIEPYFLISSDNPYFSTTSLTMENFISSVEEVSLDGVLAVEDVQGDFAENPVDLGTRCTVFMNSNRWLLSCFKLH